MSSSTVGEDLPELSGVALQMVDDVVISDGRDVCLTVPWMGSPPTCIPARQRGEAGGDPFRLGSDPRIELACGQPAVPLDDCDPQVVGLNSTEWHGFVARACAFKHAFDLAEPVPHHLRDVGKQLRRAPPGLRLGAEDRAERPRRAGVDGFVQLLECLRRRAQACDQR